MRELRRSRARIADERRARAPADRTRPARRRAAAARGAADRAGARRGRWCARDPERGARALHGARAATSTRRSRSCGRSPTASTRRCWPTAGSRRRCAPSRRASRLPVGRRAPRRRPLPARDRERRLLLRPRGAAERAQARRRARAACTSRLDGARPAQLRFSVRDDGARRGARRMRPGAGITNMRDRVAAVGGESCTSARRPASARVVQGRVPRRDDAAPEASVSRRPVRGTAVRPRRRGAARSTAPACGRTRVRRARSRSGASLAGSSEISTTTACGVCSRAAAGPSRRRPCPACARRAARGPGCSSAARSSASAPDAASPTCSKPGVAAISSRSARRKTAWSSTASTVRRGGRGTGTRSHDGDHRTTVPDCAARSGKGTPHRDWAGARTSPGRLTARARGAIVAAWDAWRPPDDAGRRVDPRGRSPTTATSSARRSRTCSTAPTGSRSSPSARDRDTLLRGGRRGAARRRRDRHPHAADGRPTRACRSPAAARHAPGDRRRRAQPVRRAALRPRAARAAAPTGAPTCSRSASSTAAQLVSAIETVARGGSMIDAKVVEALIARAAAGRELAARRADAARARDPRATSRAATATRRSPTSSCSPSAPSRSTSTRSS